MVVQALKRTCLNMNETSATIGPVGPENRARIHTQGI